MPKHLYKGEGEKDREIEAYHKELRDKNSKEESARELHRQLWQIDDMKFKRAHRAKVRKSLGLKDD